MVCDDIEALKDILGKRITDLRIKRGLSLRKFALIAELENSQLVNIEKGRVDIKITTIFKIAKALNIEVKELFDFENKGD